MNDRTLIGRESFTGKVNGSFLTGRLEMHVKQDQTEIQRVRFNVYPTGIHVIFYDSIYLLFAVNNII